MRDYQKIFMLAIWDDPATFPSQLAFFKNDQEIDAQGWFALYESFYTNPQKFAGYRWFGWDKRQILNALNTAYFQFANRDVFLQGNDDPDVFGAGTTTPIIFTESPRSSGFNSQTEKKRAARAAK